jgi:uncharacterized membrane protein YqgA involved in biofilm formation
LEVILVIGLGTIVNVVAIIAGGIIGVFIKRGLPNRFKDTVVQAIGLSVCMIGISGALQGMFKVIEGGSIDKQYTMILIFSLIIGGLIGELINIEDKLDRVGNWFQYRFAKEGGSFAQGFVTASLVFCVGAMAIVGSLEDGLLGNPSTLFAKSILDGVLSIVLASTMGIGVVFSAVPILIYQGGVTLLAGLVKPLLTDVVILQMSMVGSILILGIGINILEIKKVKVGNLLPAMFVPIAYYVFTLFF